MLVQLFCNLCATHYLRLIWGRVWLRKPLIPDKIGLGVTSTACYHSNLTSVMSLALRFFHNVTQIRYANPNTQRCYHSPSQSTCHRLHPTSIFLSNPSMKFNWSIHSSRTLSVHTESLHSFRKSLFIQSPFHLSRTPYSSSISSVHPESPIFINNPFHSSRTPVFIQNLLYSP